MKYLCYFNCSQWAWERDALIYVTLALAHQQLVNLQSHTSYKIVCIVCRGSLYQWAIKLCVLFVQGSLHQWATDEGVTGSAGGRTVFLSECIRGKWILNVEGKVVIMPLLLWLNGQQ